VSRGANTTSANFLRECVSNNGMRPRCPLLVLEESAELRGSGFQFYLWRLPLDNHNASAYHENGDTSESGRVAAQEGGSCETLHRSCNARRNRDGWRRVGSRGYAAARPDGLRRPAWQPGRWRWWRPTARPARLRGSARKPGRLTPAPGRPTQRKGGKHEEGDSGPRCRRGDGPRHRHRVSGREAPAEVRSA
jgi:hypothetical protein